MSRSQVHALSANSFQLAACLDEYEMSVAKLVKRPQDADLYRQVSHLIDQMRSYSASMPPVAVLWVELLIRHFEFIQATALHPGALESSPRTRELYAQLRAAVSGLSAVCMQHMTRH